MVLVNPYKKHPAEHSAVPQIPTRPITGEIISLWWKTLPERDGLRVARCGVRVAGCGLRVTGCGLRVAGLSISDFRFGISD